MPRPNSQNRNASSRRLAGQQIVAALKKRWAAKRAAAAEPEKPAVTKKTAPKKALFRPESSPHWRGTMPQVLLFAEFLLGFLGDGPEVYDPPVYIHFLVGLPLAHVELVGDNAGTHFQVLEKLRAKLEVDVRQEVERHDGGIVEVGIEQVLLDEPHAVGDAGLACILLGFFDSVGVDVDACAAGDAELLGGHDHDAAVTAAEVVQDVAFLDFAELEHSLHHRRGRGNVGDVFVDGFLGNRRRARKQEQAVHNRHHTSAPAVRCESGQAGLFHLEESTTTCRATRRWLAAHLFWVTAIPSRLAPYTGGRH